MTRKKHLINVHTSTGTTEPTNASLYLGEIAVQHTPNDPALWIKVGSDESSTDYEKFIGETEIIELIDNSEIILGSGYTYSGLPYVNSATTVANAYSALTKEVIDNEKVVAIALNDLNGRVIELSGNTGGAETDPIFSSSVAAGIKQTDIDKWNAAAGGGSTDPNAITGITMNGNAVSVSNRVAALGTVVTAQTSVSTGTSGAGNVLTNITLGGTNNHTLTLVKGMTIPSWATASTKPTYTASEVGALPTGTTLDNVADGTTRKLSNYATTGTVNTLNNTVTAHTANTSIHVTTAQTAAWNGKQDAISDLSEIRSNAASGMAAYNNVNALSAATVAHTENSDIHVTSTEKSTWNGKANTSDITITGLTVGGTNATVTNKVAAVPTASTSTFGVVKVPAQATSFLTNSNGTIGVATGTGTNQVAKGSDFAAVSAATTAHTSNSAIHVPTGGTNGQVLMVEDGVPKWVTPSTITYSSSAPTGGNDGDIWIQIQ